ncbi:hypothetical protein SDJN03_30181, partial [Cucurbita argyrosperma subsp. sororia]
MLLPCNQLCSLLFQLRRRLKRVQGGPLTFGLADSAPSLVRYCQVSKLPAAACSASKRRPMDPKFGLRACRECVGASKNERLYGWKFWEFLLQEEAPSPQGPKPPSSSFSFSNFTICLKITVVLSISQTVNFNHFQLSPQSPSAA